MYQVIEQIDKEFLQRNFDDDDGNLFKNKAWSQFEDFGSDIDAYKQIYELKTNEEEDDWSGFINLMDVINNTSESEFSAAIEEIFNVDRFLKVLAVDVATNNWDSYLQHGRNWYLYEDLSTGLFHWIPWDYNFALGGGGFNDQDNDDCEMIPFFAPFVLDGNKVQFYDFSFSSSAIEYSWDFGDGSTSQEAEPEHKYLTGGTFNVCLTITASPECFETRCIAVNVSDSHESCSIFDDSDFTHEDQRGLAILFNFLPICCNIWSSVCEEEYQNLTGSGDGGFTFRIDQRQNEGILINRILNVPEFFDRYLDFYCEFLVEDYTFEKYTDLIDRNKALIEDHIFEDPNFLFEYETFESDLGTDGLKKILKSKIDALNKELTDLNPSCNLTSTSVAALGQDFTYSIFPNPASDHIRVTKKSNHSDNLNVRIFSIAGILKFQAIEFDVNNQIIDTSSFGDGIYIVQILDSTGQRSILKFLKS